MWKLVLSYVPVKGWVINSDVDGLHDGPSGAMCLPAYDSEAVHTDRMSCGLAMLTPSIFSITFTTLVPSMVSMYVGKYNIFPQT